MTRTKLGANAGNVVDKFVVNHVRGKMCLPLDVDLQDMDWDELPNSQSERAGAERGNGRRVKMQTKKALEKWYDLALWRNKLRPMCLNRDPICVICLANGDIPPKPSTVVDHIIPFASASSESAAWDLFTDLDKNLRGICKRHHDEKTATQDSGFGNASRKYNPTRKIGITGSDDPQQFASSSLPSWQLDRALGSKEDIDELLKDLPE